MQVELIDIADKPKTKDLVTQETQEFPFFNELERLQGSYHTKSKELAILFSLTAQDE